MRRMIKNKTMLGLVATAAIAASCGKKDDSSTSDAPPEANSGALALNYAMAALSSSQKAPTTTTNLAKVSASRILDAEKQSETFPDCTNKAAPWDRTTNDRMLSTNPAYAQTTLFCQTNIEEAAEGILGSMVMNQQILCALESAIGEIEYTADGKVYENVPIAQSAGCFKEGEGDGIPADLKAKVTATSYSSGDWQKGVALSIDHPEIKVSFSVFVGSKNGNLAVKAIEGWDAATRRDASDAGVPADATGTRGSVISIDRNNGILRAEYTDTYWGTRSRLYAKGTFNATTGKFGDLTELSGAFSNVYGGGQGISGRYASVKGTAADGFKYNSAQFTGASLSALQFTNATPTCVPASACSGNAGITFTGTEAEQKYMSLGGAYDSVHQSRAAVQTWLGTAGDLTFTEFTTAVTL